MTFPVADIQRDVRIALDYNPTSDALLGTADVDTLTLEEVILNKVEDASRLVILAAPQHLLDGGEPFAQQIVWESHPGYGMGSVPLPDDFLRLVTFKMSDWDLSVTSAITEDDPAYLVQRSRYPGLRGNPQRPVAAVVMRPSGLVLEFFSCTQGPDVSIQRARYIPIPRIIAGAIDFPEKLRPAVIQMTASLVAAATGQPDLAGLMRNAANDLMQ